MHHTKRILLDAAVEFSVGPLLRIIKCLTIYRPMELRVDAWSWSDLLGVAVRAVLLVSLCVKLPGALVLGAAVLLSLSLLARTIDTGIQIATWRIK